MKENVTVAEGEEEQLELSLKPKLLIFALTAVFWGTGQFYFYASLTSR